MSEENNVQQNEETAVSQTDEQPTQDENVDYKALYLDEIQNSKKYRKRAQESETANKDFLKQQETAKVKNLKNQQKYKELYEDVQSKYDSIVGYKDKWEQHEANTRDALLSELPENDRKMLEGKDLDTLSYIVKQRKELSNAHKPNNPKHQSGNVSTEAKISENPFEANEATGNNWAQVVDNYKKKQQLNR
jgi:hypothetical protein